MTGDLLRHLAELGNVGRDGDGALSRLAFTDQDRAGRDLVRDWFLQAGLTVEVDRIGNIFGIWNPAGVDMSRPEHRPVMTGSHIDTVRNAGIYDGPLGVLAGLAAIKALMAREAETGVMPARPLVVAVFGNEEGVRYTPDMMGSLVHAGGLDLATALDTIGTDGSRLGDELSRMGYAGDTVPGTFRPAAFLELHVEQGPVLEHVGDVIGVVENLQGISWQRVTIAGTANHAGTTPTALRADAGLAAARVQTYMADHLAGDTTVATVGSLTLSPGVINVIPARAEFTIDLRDPDNARLQAAEQKLAAYLDELSTSARLTITTEQLVRFDPVAFDEGLCTRIAAAADRRGLSHRPMTSGAGHDAQMMARLCPTAMIFVPSRDGISHNPAEHTDPAHLIAGADVLLDVLAELVGM